jgi:DNA/RNA endonuclease YhcR with UshA esterase domain
MRKLFVTAIFTMAVFLSVAQTKIPVDSVSKHIGDSVTVCAEVYGVKSLEKLTFINLGAAHPNAPLTVVIFAKDLPAFNGTPELLYGNKKVCVSGRLETFKGKTQVVITKPEQITVQ